MADVAIYLFDFYSMVPLFLLAQQETNRIRFFLCSMLAMFIWNVGTTWWIWNSTAAGAIGAIVANCFLMAIPLWGFHTIKSSFGHKWGLFSFVVFWLTFEYIHLNWQLSWPWLTLGNVFATNPNWVQWYEVTGTSGGSLWVLLVNVVTYLTIHQYYQKPVSAKKNAFVLAALVILPLAISFFMIPQSAETTAASNVVIVQPNIDPYNEKFAEGGATSQINKLISLAESAIDSNTKLVVWPETAVPVDVEQSQVRENNYYQPIFAFADRHPNITLLTGSEMYRWYGTNKLTGTARKTVDGAGYYDAFNSALSIQAQTPLQLYNKSKLVPGVETLPDFLLWLADIFEQFGGTTGGYGRDTAAVVFTNSLNPYKAAPVICYESIYGEYVASYVRKGANLIAIITNDGWWGNTAGHSQHLNYARLRALETRKWVARSANTGISAVIDNSGKIVMSEGWDKTAVIKYAIPIVEGQTFFVQYGDLLSPVAIVLAIIIMVYNLWWMVTKRIKRRASIPRMRKA